MADLLPYYYELKPGILFLPFRQALLGKPYLYIGGSSP